MKTTVIHHSADFDGIFCREIAKKFLPDSEVIGWDFKDEPIQIPSEGTIYILDLPVDRVFGMTFGEEGHLPWLERVVWIDHHKSSIDSHPKEIPGYRIDGVAACRLAWQWFSVKRIFGTGLAFPKEDFIDRKVSEPLAVRLAGEYDIWDKRDPNAEIFQFGLRSIALTNNDWSQMLSMEKPSIEDIERMADIGLKDVMYPDGTVIPPTIHRLLSDGKLLQTYQQRNDGGTMTRSFMVTFEGLQFLALNTAGCNSLTFAAKDVPLTGHDALMGFYFGGKKWTVSLYHANHRKDIDLSLIAVKHGGGGHRGACGFTSDTLPFIP